MKRTSVVIVIVLAAVVVAALIVSHTAISKRVYGRTARELAGKMSPKLNEKYGKELEYTLDKFWSCYEGKLVSQNDLTEVVDRMRELIKKEELTDMEVFDFIGDVSHTYTQAMHEFHKKQLTE